MKQEMQYKLICQRKKGLKNISLRIKRVGDEIEVVVRTPFLTSQAFIDNLLEEKKGWIEKKVLLLQQKTVLYKSQKPQQDYEEHFKKRVEFFAHKMDLNYSKLVFKNLKSRWGSCNSLGVIVLNIQLAKVEKELQDYVIVHELAHLKYMNHSKEFHKFVESFLPNARKLQKELDSKYTLA